MEMHELSNKCDRLDNETVALNADVVQIRGMQRFQNGPNDITLYFQTNYICLYSTYKAYFMSVNGEIA